MCFGPLWLFCDIVPGFDVLVSAGVVFFVVGLLFVCGCVAVVFWACVASLWLCYDCVVVVFRWCPDCVVFFCGCAVAF